MSSPRPPAEPSASRAADPTTVRLDGPAPEVRISRDMVRRGLWVAPAIIVISAMIWDSAGAWSSAYGLGLVLANFLASAALIALASKISLALLMGATLFGYLIRLGVIFVAVWLVRDESWISFPALGATIIVSHLGLLVWELKYVAISLAHSGVRSERPAAPASGEQPDN